MASLLLALLASALLSCRLRGPFRSWLTEAERPRGPAVAAAAAAAAAKDTEARGRPRLVSIKERLVKDGWRLTEKLLTDTLEDMMVVWKSNTTGSSGLDPDRRSTNQDESPGRCSFSATSARPSRNICILICRQEALGRSEDSPAESVAMVMRREGAEEPNFY